VTGFAVEPGSFRDPASSVFYLDGRVLRGFDQTGWADFEALAATGFYQRATEHGELVKTTPVELATLPPAAQEKGFAGVVEHERVPVVSYPFEWTFSMLRAAALVHLDLLLQGLADGFTMKDGYAYNLQFRGARPVFIDVGSFTRVQPGEPWAGYRQFCQTMLYPLLLQAHRGVRFQPFLRGSLQGISPQDARGLLRGASGKAGVLKHVVLHQAMDARMSGARASDTRKELQAAGFSAELQVATVKAIRKLVAKLAWKDAGPGKESTWSNYQQTSTYSEAERERKQAFVERALGGAATLVLAAIGFALAVGRYDVGGRGRGAPPSRQQPSGHGRGAFSRHGLRWRSTPARPRRAAGACGRAVRPLRARRRLPARR